MITTEINRGAFAYKIPELAPQLLDMPSDSLAIRLHKIRQGYHTCGVTPGALQIINQEGWFDHKNDPEGKRRDFLLSTEGFEQLLYLSGTSSPIIENLGFIDELVRYALWRGTEAKITSCRVRLKEHELLEGFRLEERWLGYTRNAIKTLSRFQRDLLKRVSPLLS